MTTTNADRWRQALSVAVHTFGESGTCPAVVGPRNVACPAPGRRDADLRSNPGVTPLRCGATGTTSHGGRVRLAGFRATSAAAPHPLGSIRRSRGRLTIRQRVDDATRWRHTRALPDLPVVPPSSNAIARDERHLLVRIRGEILLDHPVAERVAIDFRLM